jgi:NAD-dependent deacetylase
MVVFSGAGLSAESGLPTFRAADGLWESHKVEDVATPEGFSRDPKLVLDFYAARLRACQAALPNAAHLAIARLQERYEVVNFTQNVDDLLERAGCSHVHHLHGSLFRRRCPTCEYATHQTAPVRIGDSCPQCGAQLRPDVVWFGEAVHMPARTEVARMIYRMVTNLGVFICIGTSLQVYPAARVVTAFARVRRKYVINPEPVRPSGFTLLQGPAASQMVALAEALERGDCL